MLKQLVFVILFFFVPKFITFFYEGMRSYNEFNRYKLDAAVQVVDLFNFSFLLWIFRPRKEWPEYFSLGLADTGRMANNRNNNNQAV